MAELASWATHGPAEVDLLWQEHGRSWAVELEHADPPRYTRSTASAVADLELAHLRVVYPGDREHALARGVSTLPLSRIGARWRYR